MDGPTAKATRSLPVGLHTPKASQGNPCNTRPVATGTGRPVCRENRKPRGSHTPRSSPLTTDGGCGQTLRPRCFSRGITPVPRLVAHTRNPLHNTPLVGSPSPSHSLHSWDHLPRKWHLLRPLSWRLIKGNSKQERQHSTWCSATAPTQETKSGIVFYFELYYRILRGQDRTLGKVLSGHAKSNPLMQSECSSQTLNQIGLEAQINCQHLQTHSNQHNHARAPGGGTAKWCGRFGKQSDSSCQR